jgi:hypothetical protein
MRIVRNLQENEVTGSLVKATGVAGLFAVPALVVEFDDGEWKGWNLIDHSGIGEVGALKGDPEHGRRRW